MSFDLTQVDSPDAINIASVKGILSPGRCVSPQELKAFLVMSRKHSDYSVHTGIPRTGPCDDYITSTVFSAWLSRDYVLDYCDFIADQAAENKLDTTEKENSSNIEKVNPIDPRLDPYGNRDYGRKSESVESSIRSWIARERSVEDIIRQDTVKFLLRKCGPSLLLFQTTSTRLTANPNTYNGMYEAFKESHKEIYNEK